MQQEGTDADWFYNDYKNILEFLLETTKKSSRKTILSALYVLTNRPEYHELMIADAKDINQEYKNQKKSDKQEKNWISVGKIKEKYQELLSVNMLRHIFLSHYYKDTPKVTDMEEMATNMGHSVSTALRQYVKKD